jgi:SAM-dependent methyltransferase/N-acetylglutamate synthase-like GNAT family acetyltransferase
VTDIKETVRDRYATSARKLADEADGTPPSLGLGDPVTLAQLEPGETVLDLGSGPGRDLLAAARAVGASGRAIGVDMTAEMIERARSAASRDGLSNVSIIDGDLERLPLPCGSVDVVISNCVINLVPDKRRALIESFRVLRPGGRLAVLDTAFETEPPAEIRNDPAAWCGCVGGSLLRAEYESILREIGFEDVRIERQTESCGEACSVDDIRTLSVAVTATKPGVVGSPVVHRPAVPAERDAIESLLVSESLPIEGLHIEDAVVALDGGELVGAITLERYGPASLLRALVVTPSHRKRGIGRGLVGAALDIARWSGGEEVYLLTENAQTYFGEIFTPVSFDQLKDAVSESVLVGCCSNATAMRLSFEDADLPLLGKPSKKPLPTFDKGACC